jgi:hypothetical protein
MAVEGVPSSESRWISLSATSSPVWRLRPLNTCGRQQLCREQTTPTHSSIGSLAELLQLLEGAGVSSVVHGGGAGRAVAVAEVADADGGVGAVGSGECAGVYGLEAGVLGVPEEGRGGRQLAGNAQRGGGVRVVGGWG